VREGMGEGHRVDYYEVSDQQVLGHTGFAESLRKQGMEPPTPTPNRSLDQILNTLSKHLHIDPVLLLSPDRSWAVSRARTLIAYTVVRRLGFPLADLAAHLDRDAATVSTLISRLAARMHGEPQVRRQIDRLARIV
jgi:chromosomal replication initiation ATPase DnaA